MFLGISKSFWQEGPTPGLDSVFGNRFLVVEVGSDALSHGSVDSLGGVFCFAWMRDHSNRLTK